MKVNDDHDSQVNIADNIHQHVTLLNSSVTDTNIFKLLFEITIKGPTINSGGFTNRVLSYMIKFIAFDGRFIQNMLIFDKIR